jgi:putative flavoprotein involved in K+ transport
MSSESFGTVVIGAGQAGLATGYYLQAQGGDFVIVDAHGSVGQAWRDRWDSLRLFTPAHWTHLPGLRFPAGRRHLPSKDEMAGYLAAYAAQFQLPIRLGWRAEELGRDTRGFVIRSGGHILRAGSVVVATGTAKAPLMPPFAGQLDPAILALHSANYRNPAQLHEGPALVVGAGNSGAEIALELAPTRRTLLAGRDTGRIPITLGGPVFQVMNRLLASDTKRGRRFAANNAGKGTPLVGIRPADLSRAGIQRLPRVTAVRVGRPVLEDGRVLEVANVIWCTGYQSDYSWITLPGLAGDTYPAHHKGAAADQAGLYFVGLPYQTTMASSLVGGVGEDARYIAGQIAARHPSQRHALTAYSP